MQTLLLLALLAPSAPLLTPSWQHEYQGRLTDRRDNETKQFTLHCVVTAGGVYWSVEEEGSGSWPWSARFGKLTKEDELGPSLLYQRDDVTGVVELASPKFSDAPLLKPGRNWSRGGRDYAASKEGEHWRVTSTDIYGNKESLLVDGEQPLLRKLRRDVVLGRGERHLLKLELTKSKPLGEQDLKQARADYEALLSLRRKLGRSDRARSNRWTKPQLASLREGLPESAAFGLAAVVKDAQADVRAQGVRANALQSMQKEAIGKSIPFELSAAKLGGPAQNSEELKGKVVVLHFWTYRSKPLEEPYGQTGYVDFLYRKLPKEQAAVIGVAAYNKDVTATEAAREAARKMTEFMNLSFPVTVDDGSLLKQLGDPRAAESGLPLFVVLDRQGKVIHYHPGNYEVDTREGLKELRGVVLEALKP